MKEDKGKSVIDNMELAQKLFTAKYLFLKERVKLQAEANLEVPSVAEYHQRMKDARAEYDNLDGTSKSKWEAASRAEIAKQPFIKDRIIGCLT